MKKSDIILDISINVFCLIEIQDYLSLCLMTQKNSNLFLVQTPESCTSFVVKNDPNLVAFGNAYYIIMNGTPAVISRIMQTRNVKKYSGIKIILRSYIRDH